MTGFPPRIPRTGRRQRASHNSTPLKALYVLRRMHTFAHGDGENLERRIRYIKLSRTRTYSVSRNLGLLFTPSTGGTQWGNPSPISAHPTSATPRTGRRAA